MTQPNLRPVVVGIEEMLLQARRLGLLQVYRPATVFLTPTDLTQVQVVLDGDTSPIRAQSLIGGVATGARVMIMTVPPQGVYIIGFVGLSGALSARTSFVELEETTDTEWEGVSGALYYLVECQGGGGAGGGAQVSAAGQHSKGSGGGSGGYSKSFVLASDLDFPITYRAGTGGAGVSAAAGGAGTSSIFDTSVNRVYANGGGGGAFTGPNAAAGYGVEGGAAGTLGVGDFAVQGRPGHHGMGSANLCAGGNGADSFFGGGGLGRASGSGTSSLAGGGATGYGAGGGGAAVNAAGASVAGGSGTNGIIVVTAFFH